MAHSSQAVRSLRCDEVEWEAGLLATVARVGHLYRVPVGFVTYESRIYLLYFIGHRKITGLMPTGKKIFTRASLSLKSYLSLSSSQAERTEASSQRTFIV